MERGAQAKTFVVVSGIVAAAWAFACGLGYFSFFGQLKNLRLHEADPAPISSEWVLIIKGVLWAMAIVALALSLRRLPEAER